jgi:hypothetical protein
MPLYAHAGIPEAWLVDLPADRIDVYRDPVGGQYATLRSISRGDALIALHFPDVTFRADEPCDPNVLLFVREGRGMTQDAKLLIAVTLLAACSSSGVTGTSGREWVVQASGTTSALSAVWGSSTNDVFAVGESGAVVHFDGIAWRAQTSGIQDKLVGVWGSSPTDVFAVGRAGSLLHFDGIAWSQRTPFPLLLGGIWGSAANDVFVFGTTLDASAFAVILHYDGTSWSADTLRDAAVLGGMWGASSSNVVAVGGSGVIVRYDGSRWAPEHWGDILLFLNAVWGSAATNVFAVGGLQDGVGNVTSYLLHSDGVRWTQVPGVALPDVALSDVWGASSRDVFAVGTTAINNRAVQNGVILHYDGRSWTRERTVTLEPLSGVWGVGGDVFAVGGGGFILRGSQ